MRDRSKRRKFNANYRRTFKIGKVTSGFVIVTAIFVLSLLYLSQSNKMALKGYDIAKLEQEKQDLLAERERLEIESTRLQSIQEIEKGLKDSGMVPVKKINYLPENTNVAMNR
jgi:hypothetical protein